jgi:hypothetical protein
MPPETIATQSAIAEPAGVCIYCGAVGPVTRDHVFPRALFIRMDPVMITVPACATCQATKARGDIDLLDFVNLEINGSRHPNAADQLEQIGRAARRNRSPIARAAHEHGVDDDLITDAGIYLGQVFTAPIDDESMLTTIGFIVRGIYFYETGSMLPIDTPVEVSYIPPLKAKTVLDRFRRVPRTSAVMKGNTVAGWVSYRPHDAPLTTLWLLEFNGGVYFMGGTGRAAEIRHRQPMETTS